MSYSKQTWDTTSYVNPTRMNHIESGIADDCVQKTGDTMTGNLNIDTGDSNNSKINLGGSQSYGAIRLYAGNTGKRVEIYPSVLSGNRSIELPDKSGTLALSGDAPKFVSISMGTNKKIKITSVTQHQNFFVLASSSSQAPGIFVLSNNYYNNLGGYGSVSVGGSSPNIEYTIDLGATYRGVMIISDNEINYTLST